MSEMENMLLISLVVCIFIGGYVLMDKLDDILKKIHRETGFQPSVLRIAYEDESILDSLSKAFQTFHQLNPECTLYLFRKEKNEIKKDIKKKKIDFGLLDKENEKTYILWNRGKRNVYQDLFIEGLNVNHISLHCVYNSKRG